MADSQQQQPVTFDQLGEEELVRAVQERRPGAFDAFVERYGGRLMAFGIRMCRSREDAEDVLQETLIKAYEGLGDLREPRAVRTWLFKVAANACRMKRRKEKPSRNLSLDSFKPPGWEDDYTPEVPDWSDVPEDSARQVELREALEEAIAELPDDYKRIVLLRDVEGLSTAETAETLDIGVSAAKMRLHRARVALRQELEEYEEELAVAS